MTRMHRRRQGGFSLLEVLIAVLVLAIGLLGLAGLQSLSLKYNHSAYLRSQAVQLGYDMADRIRANLEALPEPPDPVGTATPATPGPYNQPNFAGNLANLPADPNCIATGCTTPADVADYDFRLWNHHIRDTLPDGFGVVSNPAFGLIEIAVSWTEQVDVDGDGTADLQTFVLRFSP
jgi:type IV pilus assembly protein PilV